jgi:hypothetical protein
LERERKRTLYELIPSSLGYFAFVPYLNLSIFPSMAHITEKENRENPRDPVSMHLMKFSDVIFWLRVSLP